MLKKVLCISLIIFSSNRFYPSDDVKLSHKSKTTMSVSCVCCIALVLGLSSYSAFKTAENEYCAPHSHDYMPGPKGFCTTKNIKKITKKK